MKINSFRIVGMLLIFGSAFYFLTNCREKDGAFAEKSGLLGPEAPGGSIATPPTPLPIKELNRKAAGKPSPPLSEEVRALRAMVELVREAAQPETSIEQTILKLREFGVEPDIFENNNPDTGSLYIVRTKNPFRGTRYFHAQYFGGEGAAPFLQHVSFEFRPGPSAMREAIAAVEDAFPKLGKPTENSADFRQYAVGDDYIVWIKKMNAEDLQDDAFNAYDASDLGTIQVTVELEIHEDDQGGHEH